MNNEIKELKDLLDKIKGEVGEYNLSIDRAYKLTPKIICEFSDLELILRFSEKSFKDVIASDEIEKNLDSISVGEINHAVAKARVGILDRQQKNQLYHKYGVIQLPATETDYIRKETIHFSEIISIVLSVRDAYNELFSKS
ncbi:hypothetical protein DRN69_01225 [Candidatus Pacearchaeota archaeon]|nr:MAG: hypothetical protein DRN69_01225 [Candidatus Pacearchaeota archaeon]